MEYIKVTKIDNVVLHKKGISSIGTLHLTTHHLIFTSYGLSKEFWFPYPMINSVFKNNGSALISKYKDINDLINHEVSKLYKIDQQKSLVNWYTLNDFWSVTNIKIIGKDYTIFSIDFAINSIANDVYDSLFNLTILSSLNQLYAFIYSPNNKEITLQSKSPSWNLFDPQIEFEREGLNFNSFDSNWRLTNINQHYKISETYPSKLFVPTKISDTLIKHASKYRSKARFPTLAYYYKRHNCSITRASQPLPGLTKQRSIQDENLISTIFSISSVKDQNLIVDARPLTNALAQIALGGGTEIIDYYNFNNTSKRLFLGIDNIHIVSDTMTSLIDNFLIDSDIFVTITDQNNQNCKYHNWIKYIKLILSSVDKLSKSMIFNGSNILVHCSDGWDRTAQIISLVQICIDPFFRTLEGFMILIEKDWVSFGHKFRERSHHLSSTDNFHDNTTNLFNNTLSMNDNPFTKLREKTSHFTKPNVTSTSSSNKFASPIFQQFIDCVYQLQQQNPNKFEFNERFLRRLIYHLYSCQYGTFIFNCEEEVNKYNAKTNTRSVWDNFRTRKDLYINKSYQHINSSYKEIEQENLDIIDWITLDLSNIKWWTQLYGRTDGEMNNKIFNETNMDSENNHDNNPDINYISTSVGSTSTSIVESTKEFLSYFTFDKFKNQTSGNK